MNAIEVNYEMGRYGRFSYAFAVSTETNEYVGTSHIRCIPEGYKTVELTKGVYDTIMVSRKGYEERVWRLRKVD